MENDSPNLPPEIISNIISRLPVKSLCRFKSVSKPFLSLITEPHFIKTHLHRSNNTQKLAIASRTSPHSVYSLDYQAPAPIHPTIELQKPSNSGTISIAGSCNGMLLLDIVDQEFYLWNPTTRISQKFLTPSYSDGVIIYGLCYDSVTDDFKVVRAIRPISAKIYNPTEVYVFSSKSNSWKRIQDLGYKVYGAGGGAVLNGAPHWVLSRDTGAYRDFFVSSIINVIVYFDPVEERFKEVPSPDYGPENQIIELAVLSGWLCVVHDDRDSEVVNVWGMKEYGVKESWTKLFVVPHTSGEYFSQPLCFAKDGEVVMVLNSEILVFYNPKDNRFRRIGIPRSCQQFDVALYVESLVSPYHGDRTRGHC